MVPLFGIQHKQLSLQHHFKLLLFALYLAAGSSTWNPMPRFGFSGGLSREIIYQTHWRIILK
jgi:hypothetical protein